MVRSGSVRYKAHECLTPEGPLANRCRLAARMPSRGFLFEPDLNARRRTGGRRKNSPRSETVRAPGGNRPPSTAAGGRLDLAVGRLSPVLLAAGVSRRAEPYMSCKRLSRTGAGFSLRRGALGFQSRGSSRQRHRAAGFADRAIRGGSRSRFRPLARRLQTELVKVLNKAVVCHARIGTWRPSSSIFQAGTSAYSLAFPPHGD